VARRCAYCEKKPVVGNKISHSNIKTKVRHMPNLQRVRAFLDGVAQRVYVCTRCLRSGALLKPLVQKRPVAATAPAPGAETASA
jgi:large subunit ribosomal protein L28